MAKYLSGRSKKTPQSKLPADRYKYLSVGDAEPNLGDPTINSTEGNLPVGEQYQIISVIGYSGERYWVPRGGGLIPGSISVYDENYLVGTSNSITQLNFVGSAISVRAVPLGVAATITVFSPGNNQEILFNTSNDFSTSSKLKFDSSLGLLSAGDRINVGIGGTVITTTGVGSVGIGTTNPTQELHVQGDLRLTGTIYDYLNRPGNEGEVLVKTNNTFNGLSWTNQSAIKSGAGGTYTNIQYHGSTGLVEGASNFVYDNINNRIGIGSTIPNYLLDVVGYSSFKGQTDIDNLKVGVATIGTLGVTGLTTTRFLDVTGIATIGTLGIIGLTTTKDLGVTGVATIGTLGVTGLTTTKDLGVTGVATIGTLGVTGLATTRFLDVTGIATIGTLGVTGLTTTQNLRVSGITTVGFLTGTDAFYTGIVTAQKFDGKIVTLEEFIETKTINVTGIGTIATLGVTTFTVSGLTSTKNLNVTGIATILDLTVTGVSTLGNVKISSNKIETKSGSGNLTIDSDGGTTVIKDSVSIDDTTQSTNKDTGALVVDGGVGIEKNLNVGGNVGLGTSSSNTVSFTSRVSSNILPSSGSLNLGSSSNRWGTVFADKFDGAVVGVADTANTVGVGTTTGTGNYFLTFVDSNNPASSRTGEMLYSDAGIVYNPSTNLLSVNGIIESSNDNYRGVNEGGQFVLRGKSGTPFRWNIDNFTYHDNTTIINLFRIFKEDDATGLNGKSCLGITTIGEVLIGEREPLGLFPTGTPNQQLQVQSGAYISGNLGIGNINPGEKLQVDGNMRVGGSNTSNYIAFRGTINDDQVPYRNTYIGERLYKPLEPGGAESSELLLFKGNDITPSGPDRIRLSAAEIRFDTYSVATGGGSFEEAATYGTNRVIITETGNVGIGTINPTSKLQVAGDVTPSVTNTYDLGTTSLKWRNIYATSIEGAITGNADTATNLKGGIASQIPYQTGDSTTSFIPNGTSGQLLQSNGTSAPSWVTPSNLSVSRADYATRAGLATDIEINATNQLLYQASNNDTQVLSQGSSGQLLQSNGTSAPSWVTPSNLSVSRADYATNAGISTNLKGGSASQIPYQTGDSTTSFIPNGTSGQLLQSNGTSAPSWVTAAAAGGITIQEEGSIVGNQLGITTVNFIGETVTATSPTAGTANITVTAASNVTVTQTGYSCDNPITVIGGSTITIGSTSNAYGRKFIQTTTPTSPCDGDIWYDTSGGTSGPAGTVIYYAASSAPTGYLKANGASLSTTTYATLFAAIGYTFGGSGASFKVPDLRGEFIRGWDDGRGVDSGRVFASWQKGTLVAGYDDNEDAADSSFLQGRSYIDYGSDTINSTIATSVYGMPNRVRWLTNGTAYADYALDQVQNWTAITRPRNIALLACIKY